VTCLDGDADIGLLEGLEAEIDSRLRGGPRNSKPVVSVIGETFSNSIQMTEARACLAENMMTELELLMRLYVEPLRVKQTRKRTGRAAIAGAMRTQFERAGVWALMRKRISASLYTLPGDPMKIDCGYRPNGVVKMFHAVSLDGDVEAAKVLAYSAPRLREGVTRVEAARLELTAVVEPLREVPEEDEGVERYRFGVEAMESQNIRVVTWRARRRLPGWICGYSQSKAIERYGGFARVDSRDAAGRINEAWSTRDSDKLFLFCARKLERGGPWEFEQR
jgi:hypothetical protein